MKVEFYDFRLLPLTLLIPLTIKWLIFEWFLHLFMIILQSNFRLIQTSFSNAPVERGYAKEAVRNLRNSVEIGTEILSSLSLV